MEPTELKKLAFDNVNVRALREMTASEGWAEWLKWSQATKAQYVEAALRSDTLADREEARMMVLALEKFEALPVFLLQLTQEG